MTRSDPLDWFVVFSSMASLIGNAGQTVYAAANAWLDGFAEWRAAQGLPTLAVNWGPWGETGAATDFAARGYTTIGTADGFSALSTLLTHDRVRSVHRERPAQRRKVLAQVPSQTTNTACFSIA